MNRPAETSVLALLTLFGIWWIPDLASADGGQEVRALAWQAGLVLVILQALTLALWAPALPGEWGRVSLLPALAWPWLALLQAIGHLPPGPLVVSQVLLLIWGWVVAWVVRIPPLSRPLQILGLGLVAWGAPLFWARLPGGG